MNILKNFLTSNQEKIPPIYLILDVDTCNQKKLLPEDLYKIALEEGIRIFQYRNKSKDIIKKNKETIQFFEKIKIHSDTCVILNDDYELAFHIGVPVHLGQGDLPSEFSSKQIESIQKIGFGASSHNREELSRLKKLSIEPDYTAFGAVFPSITKPDVKKNFDSLDEFYLWKPSIYSVLIGGISLKKIPLIENYFSTRNELQKKFTFYAMIQGVFEYGHTKENIQSTLKELITSIK